MQLKELLLVKLMEECAEVQQICAKSLRSGTEDSHTCDSGTNIARLESGLLDVLAVLLSLNINGDINLPEYTHPDMALRLERITKYMDYSKSLGILE